MNFAIGSRPKRAMHKSVTYAYMHHKQ